MNNLSFYLLALIILAFVFQMINGGLTSTLTQIGVFAPSLAFVQPWRFLTSIFLHGGITHLFFNAYALFLFGTILESKVNKNDFLILFFGAGLI